MQKMDEYTDFVGIYYFDLPTGGSLGQLFASEISKEMTGFQLRRWISVALNFDLVNFGPR